MKIRFVKECSSRLVVFATKWPQDAADPAACLDPVFGTRVIYDGRFFAEGSGGSCEIPASEAAEIRRRLEGMAR